MLFLQLVVTSCLASSTLSTPQLFPFTNLKKYFDHQTRNGPNSGENSRDLQLQPSGSVLPTLERYPGAEQAASLPPLPEQVFRPPSLAPAFTYAQPLQSKPPSPAPGPAFTYVQPAQKPAPIFTYAQPLQSKPPSPAPVPAFNYAQLAQKQAPTFTYAQQAQKPPPPSAPAFNYAPFLSAVPSSLFRPSPSPTEATTNPEDLFVDILKENPKLPRTGAPSAQPLSSAQAQVFGSGPSSSSYLGAGQVSTSKPSSSVGAVFKPKANLFSSNKYPKKYQSDLIGYNNNGDGSTSALYPKKDYSPKKEKSQLKEQQHQTSDHVAKTLTAANFQKDSKLSEASLAFRKTIPSQNEQQASETGFHGIASGADEGFGGGFGGGGGGGGGFGGGELDHHHHLGGGGDRVEFQMHGHHGPHSYKFGYDTGKGHNRQFRFEERDQHGHVKGHYGFYDKTGKLQMVNYHADQHGFHADGNFGNHENH